MLDDWSKLIWVRWSNTAQHSLPTGAAPGEGAALIRAQVQHSPRRWSNAALIKQKKKSPRSAAPGSLIRAPGDSLPFVLKPSQALPAGESLVFGFSLDCGRLGSDRLGFASVGRLGGLHLARTWCHIKVFNLQIPKVEPSVICPKAPPQHASHTRCFSKVFTPLEFVRPPAGEMVRSRVVSNN